jgi:hypothetical protein
MLWDLLLVLHLLFVWSLLSEAAVVGSMVLLVGWHMGNSGEGYLAFIVLPSGGMGSHAVILIAGLYSRHTLLVIVAFAR